MINALLKRAAAAAVCWLLLATAAPPRAAQSPATPRSEAGGACRVAGLSFACPEGFALVAELSEERLLFARHREYDLVVFVAAPAQGFDAGQFEKELRASVASKLFPAEARPYRWQPLEAPAKVSGRQVGSGAAQGFNGRRRAVVEFRRLSLDGGGLRGPRVRAGAGRGGRAALRGGPGRLLGVGRVRRAGRHRRHHGREG